MATKLTTLTSAKLFLGITNSAADALLSALIDGCSAAVDNICQRTLGQADHTLWLDGTGSRRLVLPEWPVTAFSAVEVDGAAVAPATSPTSEGYRFFDTGEVVLGPCGRFTRGVMNVRLAFTAGYADGGYPKDLELVANRMVGDVYKNRDSLGVSSKTLAGETVALFKAESERPENKATIASYRRVTP